MSESIALNPHTLPILDILSLAQSGKILRAERETPDNGIPAFVTSEGWDELINHHQREHETFSQTAQRVLLALERVVARLLAEAAHASAKHHTASLYTLETDLFPSNSQTRLALVRDKTHPVACALIGTPQHLHQMLRPLSER